MNRKRLEHLHRRLTGLADERTEYILVVHGDRLPIHSASGYPAWCDYAPVRSFSTLEGALMYYRERLYGAGATYPRAKFSVVEVLPSGHRKVVWGYDAENAIQTRNDAPVYVVELDDRCAFGEREGERTLFFPSLDEALGYLRDRYADSPPCPEHDRILVWEVLPSGHRKVVWHFSGWHHDCKCYTVLDQGVLPGHSQSLYSLAIE